MPESEKRINPVTECEELIEPGKELEKDIFYIPEYEHDPNKGIPLKVLRHVYITPDPESGSRPHYEVELPDGTTRFYLDPSVSAYKDKKGKNNRTVSKIDI